MDIVIIGSGNVAAILGRKFRNAGHRIVQVVGRNSAAASALAYEFDTVSTNYNGPITRSADVYLIAVSDHAMDDVIDDLHLKDKVVAHTAGSVPMQVLKNVTDHYGVFYPLQSLRKDMKELPAIPVYYDGSDELTKRTLRKLADSIAPGRVAEAGDDARLKLHVAAVIVNNFPNHLYALTEEYCRKEGLDFTQLLPLIEETTERLKTASAADTQTGPAIRHDKETIQKHLTLLSDHPQLKNIYLLLTESIQQGH
ncbi:MAG: F420-dependent NADP oxidoreductase [Chitinophagaceae bacterium]